MNKIKILGITVTISLALIIGAFALLAALGVFEFGEGGGINITPEEKIDIFDTSECDYVTLSTDAGIIKIFVADCPAGEKFLELAESGALHGEIKTAVKGMFIQADINGYSFETEKTDFSAIDGTVGFILDGEKASPSFVIIAAEELSGASKAFLSENGFDEESVDFYTKGGGVPEYEDKIIVFGQIDFDESDTVNIICEAENSGYTGGYSLVEPVRINSAEVFYHIEPEN